MACDAIGEVRNKGRGTSTRAVSLHGAVDCGEQLPIFGPKASLIQLHYLSLAEQAAQLTNAGFLNSAVSDDTRCRLTRGLQDSHATGTDPPRSI